MKIFFSSYQKIFCLILALSSFALGAAYFVEYILHVTPCPLCIYQRTPYFALIIVAGLGHLIGSKKWSKFFCYLCALIFLSGSAIGSYHTAIERGIVEETTTCTSPQKHNSIESLKDEIYKNTTSCKDVNFHIAGFSAAEINAVFSFLMFLYVTVSIRKNRLQ